MGEDVSWLEEKFNVLSEKASQKVLPSQSAWVGVMEAWYAAFKSSKVFDLGLIP